MPFNDNNNQNIFYNSRNEVKQQRIESEESSYTSSEANLKTANRKAVTKENEDYFSKLVTKYNTLFSQSTVNSLNNFKRSVNKFTIDNPLTDRPTGGSLFSSQPRSIK